MLRILVVSLLAVVLGCGGGAGPTRSTIPVRGKITLDGKPVDGGTITFDPKDGKGGAVSASISAGNYETRVEPGVKTVRVSYPKILRTEPVYPGSENSPMIDITEEAIPARYNSQSRLEKDLTEVSGDVNFDLSSQ